MVHEILHTLNCTCSHAWRTLTLIASTYYTIQLSSEFAYPIEPTAEHSKLNLLPRLLPPQCIWILPTSGVAVPRSMSISHFCRQIAMAFRHLYVNEHVVGVFLPTTVSVRAHSQGRRPNTTVNKMTASLFTVQCCRPKLILLFKNQKADFTSKQRSYIQDAK